MGELTLVVTNGGEKPDDTNASRDCCCCCGMLIPQVFVMPLAGVI